MNNKYKILGAVAVFMTVWMIVGKINTEAVHADSDRKTYFAGETAYADLDGDGKTETIQVKETYGHNRYGDAYLSKWKLVITSYMYLRYRLNKFGSVLNKLNTRSSRSPDPSMPK